MPNLTVLDLFSGIGGISYGLEATGGFRTVAFCEIDPFCRLVLEKHWPNVPIWENVRELSVESVRERCGRIDIIAGGFPCQPHSVAGKRKGQSDERHLWPEFSRLVREIRPTWVLAENVPGIRSTAADEVIGDLEAEGYTVWPLVVGADDVGAPHRRKRVWFVARLEDTTGTRGGRESRNPVRFGGQSGESWEAGVSARRGVAVGDPESTGADVAHLKRKGLEGTRSGASGSGEEVSESSSLSKTRWPSRPGEPQHEWEEPRLAYAESMRRDGRTPDGCRNESHGSEAGRDEGKCDAAGSDSKDTRPGSPQLPLGSATDGVSLRLVRRANREALKAYGNSVVPQVVYRIGLAIAATEEAPGGRLVQETEIGRAGVTGV